MVSTVVGIGHHPVIDASNKSGMAVYPKANPPLWNRAAVSLERLSEIAAGIIARECEQQMLDALQGYAELQLRFVDCIGKRSVAERQEALGDEAQRMS